MAEDTTGLPPAGHARREELKRRLDELTQEAEQLASQLETEGIDPAKWKIDREVAQHFTGPDAELFITDADNNYKYSWVYRDPYNKFGGRFVRAYEALGWEIVHGKEMTEAWEHRSVTGERWVADCLLMRMRCDRHAEMHRKARERRRAIEAGSTAQLEELAAKAGVKIHTNYADMPSHLQSAVEGASSSHMQTRRGFARQMATNKLDSALRAGTVPGVPVPGR